MEKIVDQEDEKSVKEAGDMANMSVIDYIQFDLERDHLSLSNALYKQILDESIEHKNKANFNPSRYFIAHPDPTISQLAADLISNRYEQSKIHLKQFGENVKIEDTPLAEEKHLAKSVPWVLTELKNAHVEANLENLLKQLETEKDFNVMKDLLLQIKELKEIKKILAKALGERVVLR